MVMRELVALYGDTIRQHARDPRWKPLRPDACCLIERTNPLCGDRMRLDFSLDSRASLDLGCEVRGCAISMASASLMYEAVQNLSPDEALALCEDFIAAASARGESWPESLVRFDAFVALRHFPARLGCACLPWYTLKDGVRQHARCQHV
jgi:nitrogen fixation NifU-like protein